MFDVFVSVLETVGQLGGQLRHPGVLVLVGQEGAGAPEHDGDHQQRQHHASTESLARIRLL